MVRFFIVCTRSFERTIRKWKVNQELGRNIRSFRKQRCIPQKVFAERVGVIQSYLSAIEHGRRKPSITLLERIAKELQVSLSFLLPVTIQVSDDIKLIKILNLLEELRNSIVDFLASSHNPDSDNVSES